VLFALADRLALIIGDRTLRFTVRPPLPPFAGELLFLLPDGPFVFAVALADDGRPMAVRLDLRRREAEAL